MCGCWWCAWTSSSASAGNRNIEVAHPFVFVLIYWKTSVLHRSNCRLQGRVWLKRILGDDRKCCGFKCQKFSVLLSFCQWFIKGNKTVLIFSERKKIKRWSHKTILPIPLARNGVEHAFACTSAQTEWCLLPRPHSSAGSFFFFRPHLSISFKKVNFYESVMKPFCKMCCFNKDRSTQPKRTIFFCISTPLKKT